MATRIIASETSIRLLVVAHSTAPADHPSEGSLDDPAARGKTLKPPLVVGSSDDLDDEVEVGGLVHELQPVIGAVGEQMLHPGPIAERREDPARSRRTAHQAPDPIQAPANRGRRPSQRLCGDRPYGHRRI